MNSKSKKFRIIWTILVSLVAIATVLSLGYGLLGR
jgi:hypothetical protein